jgi:hypothetical protein
MPVQLLASVPMRQDHPHRHNPGFAAALRRYFREIRDFSRIETGAVTVDWVVLTAATVGLGLASVAAVRSGVGDLGGGVGDSLNGAQVATLGTLGVSGILEPIGVWSHSYSGQTAGGRCAPGPGCPPPTLYQFDYLRLNDGTIIRRETRTIHPGTENEEVEAIIWTDAAGTEIDAPDNQHTLPDILR